MSDDVKIVMPLNKIKQKVGHGGVSEERLNKADEIFTRMAHDFPAIAKDDLDTIEEIAERLSKTGVLTDEERTKIQDSAIMLKSSGAMFHYPIVTDMAHSLLNFIENVPEIRKEVIDIIIAHHKSLKLVIETKKTGDTGDYGDLLMSELTKVVKRYYNTRNK